MVLNSFNTFLKLINQIQILTNICIFAIILGTRPVVDKYSITRYSEGDWRARNKEVIDKTVTELHRANLIDWNGRQCLEQTQADVDKNQEDSTKRLNQREMELHRWKCELERAISAASEEIGFMEEQRKRLKQAGSVLTLPESISGKFFSFIIYTFVVGKYKRSTFY